MDKRVVLIDVDRPDEPLEAEIKESGDREMILTIPNTSVTFRLTRGSSGAPFEGSLGGRDYVFEPSIAKRSRPREPSKGRPISAPTERNSKKPKK